MNLPHEYRICFVVEVTPEDGDTLEGLVNYIKDLATEWLPEDFVFDVEPIEPSEPGTWREKEAT